MNRKLICTAATAALTLLAAPAFAQKATYKLDDTHTFVTFEVLHFGTSTVRGRFDGKTGTIDYDRSARRAAIDVTIDMASINSGVVAFDKHLKSADFFDVEKHPKAHFVAQDIQFDGDKPARVTGQLTLLGKTGPVVLTAERFNCYDNPFFKQEVCGGDFSTTIQRSQWGMAYGLPGIPDSVRLTVQVEAVKQ